MILKPLITSLALMVTVVMTSLAAFSPRQSSQVALAQVTTANSTPVTDPHQFLPPHRLMLATPKPRIAHRQHRKRVVHAVVAAKPVVTPTPTPAPTHNYAAPTPTPKPTHSLVANITGAAKAVAFAFDQIGCPYVYGGTGPCNSGFDCSGLVQAAWQYAGISIPRTSYDQWSSLPRVSTSELAPGDILIFYSGASHVGLYVGNGYMIDASHSGVPVQKVSLAGYYSSNLIGAVRP